MEELLRPFQLLFQWIILWRVVYKHNLYHPKNRIVVHPLTIYILHHIFHFFLFLAVKRYRGFVFHKEYFLHFKSTEHFNINVLSPMLLSTNSFNSAHSRYRWSSRVDSVYSRSKIKRDVLIRLNETFKHSFHSDRGEHSCRSIWKILFPTRLVLGCRLLIFLICDKETR